MSTKSEDEGTQTKRERGIQCAVNDHPKSNISILASVVFFKYFSIQNNKKGKFSL